LQRDRNIEAGIREGQVVQVAAEVVSGIVAGGANQRAGGKIDADIAMPAGNMSPQYSVPASCIKNIQRPSLCDVIDAARRP